MIQFISNNTSIDNLSQNSIDIVSRNNEYEQSNFSITLDEVQKSIEKKQQSIERNTDEYNNIEKELSEFEETGSEERNIDNKNKSLEKIALQ